MRDTSEIVLQEMANRKEYAASEKYILIRTLELEYLIDER